jgi:hypothetical protein
MAGQTSQAYHPGRPARSRPARPIPGSHGLPARSRADPSQATMAGQTHPSLAGNLWVSFQPMFGFVISKISHREMVLELVCRGNHASLTCSLVNHNVSREEMDTLLEFRMSLECLRSLPRLFIGVLFSRFVCQLLLGDPTARSSESLILCLSSCVAPGTVLRIRMHSDLPEIRAHAGLWYTRDLGLPGLSGLPGIRVHPGPRCTRDPIMPGYSLVDRTLRLRFWFGPLFGFASTSVPSMESAPLAPFPLWGPRLRAFLIYISVAILAQYLLSRPCTSCSTCAVASRSS